MFAISPPRRSAEAGGSGDLLLLLQLLEGDRSGGSGRGSAGRRAGAPGDRRMCLQALVLSEDQLRRGKDRHDPTQALPADGGPAGIRRDHQIQRY